MKAKNSFDISFDILVPQNVTVLCGNLVFTAESIESLAKQIRDKAPMPVKIDGEEDSLHRIIDAKVEGDKIRVFIDSVIKMEMRNEGNNITFGRS